MSFRYVPTEVPSGWHPSGADEENPGDPLFQMPRYHFLNQRYLSLALNDERHQELHRDGDNPFDRCLGHPNIRRAALGQPLYQVGRTHRELVEHLEACPLCQRAAELFQQAMQEVRP